MQIARLLGLFALLVSSSFAGVVYNFNYEATSGSFDSFSFQIKSDTFLTDSSSLTFTPFEIKSGGDIFTMTKGNLSQRCFTFGSDDTNVSNCSASPRPGSGFVQFGFFTPFPEAGTYTSMYAVAGGVTTEFQNVMGDGTMTMTISDGLTSETPEPASMALIGAGITGLGLLRFRKRAA